MDFVNKHILVVGLARSGLAAIKVLNKLGAKITLSESKPEGEIKEAEFLKSLGVEIVNQEMAVFEKKYDLCVKNPGVPFRSPAMKKLEENGVKIITEIELAFIVAKPQHYIAITGTNGKTTTTSLMYDILEKAFPGKAHLCGNIGIPLCETVLENRLMNEGGHYIALEISNFQLVNIDKFRPEAAAIINLTPDHIDFMGSLEAYYKSKTEIYRNMAEGDTFVLNADDEVLKEYTEKYPVKCKVNTISVNGENTDNFIKDGFIFVKGEKIMPVDEIKLVGRHNLQNVMVAISLAKAIGIENSVIYRHKYP